MKQITKDKEQVTRLTGKVFGLLKKYDQRRETGILQVATMAKDVTVTPTDEDHNLQAQIAYARAPFAVAESILQRCNSDPEFLSYMGAVFESIGIYQIEKIIEIYKTDSEIVEH